MIEDMQLRGLSPRTQRAYIRVVRELAEYYSKSPDQISEEELRAYFLYLKNELAFHEAIVQSPCAASNCSTSVHSNDNGQYLS
jgi:hypothetical protein